MWTLPAAFLLPLAAAAAAGPSNPEAVIQAVQAAERSSDVLTLQMLTSPEFVQHHASGMTEPRSAYLAGRSASTSNPTTGRGYLEHDVEWRRSGNAAVRTSITRIRGAVPRTDLWVRSTAVMVREGGAWRLLNLDSALLLQTPSYDGPSDEKLPSGSFSSKESGPFHCHVRGAQPYLAFDNGRENPLIATGPDLHWCGAGSTLSLGRDAAGRVTSVTRKYGQRVAWTAQPVN